MVLEDAAHFGEPRIGVLENAAHLKKGTTNCGFGGHRELNCFGRLCELCGSRVFFFFFRRGHCELSGWYGNGIIAKDLLRDYRQSS